MSVAGIGIELPVLNEHDVIYRIITKKTHLNPTQGSPHPSRPAAYMKNPKHDNLSFCIAPEPPDCPTILANHGYKDSVGLDDLTVADIHNHEDDKVPPLEVVVDSPHHCYIDVPDPINNALAARDTGILLAKIAHIAHRNVCRNGVQKN